LHRGKKVKTNKNEADFQYDSALVSGVTPYGRKMHPHPQETKPAKRGQAKEESQKKGAPPLHPGTTKLTCASPRISSYEHPVAAIFVSMKLVLWFGKNKFYRFKKAKLSIKNVKIFVCSYLCTSTLCKRPVTFIQLH